MIDRRQFVTGLAAVAVAGFASAARPGSAAPLVCVGRAFAKGDPEAFPRVYDFEASGLATGWHCHVHSFSERTLYHRATGLIFATAARDPAAVWLARPADALPVPPYTPELVRLGHAARYIRISAGVVDHMQRNSGDGRRRPFFLHFENDEYFFEDDAPPLPRVTSFVDDDI
jgi:hypothetical protein